MVFEVTGLSVRFDTSVDDGIEVITLYYRVDGRLCGCRCFTETYDSCSGVTCSALLNMMRFVYRLRGVKMSEPGSIMDVCMQLYAQWSERGAHIAAVRGFERGVLDAAEGRSECETLPYDIHRMYEDDYCRGYREGYCHGNEQPEF